MASENINVRVTGELRNHLEQQISNNGFYENASEYVRSLIRNDLKNSEESWEWLRKELEPALRADESEFVEVSARDVITRNKKKKRK
jgi:antitoxin ParD1/3/4